MNAPSIKHLPAKLLVVLTFIIAPTISSAQQSAAPAVDIDIDGNGNLVTLSSGLLSLRWMFDLKNST
jgi:hypothetical protein